jgi:2-dehydro-3-deoxyphosphogluconate aldolase/(4S)-4-hydroxy-2-oxoglutarate aldolase
MATAGDSTNSRLRERFGGQAVNVHRADVTRSIEAAGVVAVVRLKDATAGREVAEALAAGGVSAIEITMTVPGAVALIEKLAQTTPSHILIGAGTVVDATTARDVIAAGARFVVSPILKLEVIAACHSHDVPAMPGCFTPTEIATAWEAGADIVKVFPATTLGPAFFKDVRGPLPHVRLMPTGGVTRENAGAWIRAGAVAIGVGTALVDPVAVAERRFDVITDNARHFVKAVQDARAATEGARKS